MHSEYFLQLFPILDPKLLDSLASNYGGRLGEGLANEREGEEVPTNKKPAEACAS